MMFRLTLACYALCGALILACGEPHSLATNALQVKTDNYPLVIEASQSRQQAAEEAWALFLVQHRLPDVKPDFEPVLFTPRALPTALANRINLNPKGGAFGDAQATDALRRFIEQANTVLGSDHRSNAISLKDLSLITFSNEGNLYRAVYQQMNYPFPLANGYGELRFVLSKTGALLQMSSRLVPTLEIPTRPAIESTAIPDKLLNREFTYTNIAGQPLRYKVTRLDEISVKDLVVYPKLDKDKLLFYLAYPVEVGRGTTWMVYIDAIKGAEIDVKQNFAS